ncbi:unnamed protein product, partial [Owenia fusiformis]
DPSSTFYKAVKKKSGIFDETTNINDVLDLTGASTEEFFFSSRFVLSKFVFLGDSCFRNTFIRSRTIFRPSIEAGLNDCATQYYALAQTYNYLSHYFRRDTVAFINLAKEFQEG